MEEKEILNIIKFHNLCCKLKTTLRSGWKIWHVEADRIESIAEHVFGVCMLATAILSSYKNHGMDENKIITMLALHELEEVIIGDITLYETDKVLTKKQEGEKAIEQMFSDFVSPYNFKSIIAEFEAFETPEAKFAKRCDKLEADLQAYMYENNIDYSKSEKFAFEAQVVKDAIKNGATCLGDYFVYSDAKVFDDEFKQIAKVAEKFYKNKIN